MVENDTTDGSKGVKRERPDNWNHECCKEQSIQLWDKTTSVQQAKSRQHPATGHVKQ
jgi:hypothetical protein